MPVHLFHTNLGSNSHTIFASFGEIMITSTRAEIELNNALKLIKAHTKK